jgi:1-phosphofructokinase family hexose kinase
MRNRVAPADNAGVGGGRRAVVRTGGDVVCLSLSPAVQRTLVFARFQADAVNRADASFVTVGGKGVNTALALARLRRAGVVTGLNGGDTGKFVVEFMKARGVTCAFTRTPWPTRTCTTILDRATGEVTELVEEGWVPTAAFLQRWEAAGQKRLRQAVAAVLCGTLPRGVPENLWARLAARARQQQIPVLIDSHAAPLWQALAQEPWLAKMNACELAKTLSGTCRTEAQIVAGARKLIAAGAHWALITRGPQPAMLVNREQGAWRIRPPVLTDVVSPIGSGDCVNAGLMEAHLRGREMCAAVCFGLGCGSANARTATPADFTAQMARELAARCVVERVR